MIRITAHIPALGRSTMLVLLVGLALWGQLNRAAAAAPSTGDPATTNLATGTNSQSLEAIELELTNAYGRVLQIVNQPVRAFVERPGMHVSTFSPGWFHPGAIRPNFNNVDVRQSQELVYANHQYVTSDLNPGIVFLGQDLEFNSMTKYFYTNRNLPKHRLSEAEMEEINRLYRVIGRCQGQIAVLQARSAPPEAKPATEESSAEAPASNEPLDRLRAIPQKTRALYGGIAIGALVVIVFGLRAVKKGR